MSNRNAKHTPAPWTVHTPPEMIHMRTVLCGPKYMIKNVLPQDAHLIAAAPECLAMLERIERLGAVEFSRLHMGSLRALIRKATDGAE